MVLVSFSEQSADRLVVQDDGHRMDLATVVSTWVEPALGGGAQDAHHPSISRKVWGGSRTG